MIDRMRTDPQVPRVPVTVLVSWQDRRRPASPAAGRVNEFSDTPVSARTLAARIRRHVRRERAAAGACRSGPGSFYSGAAADVGP